jgi:hypothetical protein
LSTVPFSRISCSTWLTACCFRKSKFLPYSWLTSYKDSVLLALGRLVCELTLQHFW